MSDLYNYLRKVYYFVLSIIRPVSIRHRKGLFFERGKNNLLISIKIQNGGVNNRISIGNGCKLRNCKVRIKGSGNTLIIDDTVWCDDVDFLFEDDNNTIVIGKESRFVGDTHLACTEGKKIIVGSNCLFSNDLVFRTGDSHSIVGLSGIRLNSGKDIIISDHVWMGNKVIVLKGSQVKENSIIGSGSVLTGKVYDSNAVIAGNPAKVVKRNIDWKYERIESQSVIDHNE